MSKTILSSEQMMEILEKCYDKAIEGLPGSKSCELLALEYMEKYGDVEKAAEKLILSQIAKCSTSGFITSLGTIALPVALPANITSVLYIQMRMIASIAALGGHNVNSDEVQTLVYVCLAGSSMVDICKSAGIQVANKLTTNMIKKLPGAVLLKINKAVGFRLVTKFGTKGVINLAKLVPIAGGVVGASVDGVGTKIIAKRAYDMFLLDKID